MGLADLLQSEEMRFILFGGKGGVGKTSCATAFATRAARTGKRTLIISTDPAHSLGDSLGVKLPPGETVPVEFIPNLWALELNPGQMDSVKSELDSMPFQGDIPLVGDMMGNLGTLSPPGIDEAMAFGKVLEFVVENDDEFDLVIFDTAPTGHTLRLLGLPELLSSWIGKIVMLRLKLGKFFTGFKNIFKKKENREKDESLEMFEKLKDSIEAAKDDLSNPNRTSFVIVMIPESMAIYETERLLSSLYSYEIPVRHIIINQLFPPNIECNFCQSRREMQQHHLEEIRDLYEDEFNLTEVPLFKEEIRKLEQLLRLSEILVGKR